MRYPLCAFASKLHVISEIPDDANEGAGDTARQVFLKIAPCNADMDDTNDKKSDAPAGNSKYQAETPKKKGKSPSVQAPRQRCSSIRRFSGASCAATQRFPFDSTCTTCCSQNRVTS